MPEKQGQYLDYDPDVEYMRWVPYVIAAAVIWMLAAAYQNSFSGIYDPVESSVLYGTLRLFNDLTNPLENAARIVWPGGFAGPATYYVNAVALAVFSYLWDLPMDSAAHIPTLAAIPLTLFFTYITVKMLAGWKAGLFSMTLLAVLPFSIHAGHSVLPAFTGLFMTVLTLFFAVRCTQTEDRLLAFLAGVSAGAAFLVDATSIVVLVPVAYVVFTKFDGLRQVDYMYSVLLPFLLLSMPAAFRMASVLGSPDMPSVPGLGGVEYFDGVSVVVDRLYFITSMVYGLRVPVLLAAIAGLMVCLLTEGWKYNLILVYTGAAAALLFALSVTGLMMPYQLYVIMIPCVLLVQEFIASIPPLRFPLKQAVVAFIILYSLNASLNDQVFHERNMPLGHEVIDDREYAVGGKSLYYTASLFMIRRSSPADAIAASEPMHFYIAVNRPAERFSPGVGIGPGVRYILLSGIDNYRFAEGAGGLNLESAYNMTQGRRSMIVGYENQEYRKPVDAVEQPYEDAATLRQAVHNRLIYETTKIGVKE